MHMFLTRVSVLRGSGVKLLKLKKEIEFQENASTTIIQNSQKKIYEFNCLFCLNPIIMS